MEIWTGSRKGWVKKPFKTFSESEPLYSLLKEHQETDFKIDHWVVFSKEEEESIRKITASLYPSDMKIYDVLGAICGLLTKIFTNPPWVTYVPLNYNKPIAQEKEFRLALKFNCNQKL